MNYNYIRKVDSDYKIYLLNESKDEIDPGIKDLVNALNNIDVFCTMNSCQAFLIEQDKDKHCPVCYVDFYVLNHQYDIAYELFRILTHKFCSLIKCSVSYEADFDLIDGVFCEDNGYMDLRFRIELEEVNDTIGLYNELVEEVNALSYYLNSSIK